MDGTAGLTPDREVRIDSSDPTVAELAARMFASAIAEGEVVVADPPEAPAPAHAPPAPPAVEPQPAAPSPVPATVETPAPAPEPVAAPENVPTFKPKIDDDLRALLDEPDFDEEARAEVADEIESEEYEYADPETTAKVRALEKRTQFLEGQLVAKSKKGWVEEAKRAYPDLARLLPGEIEAIAATSRRSFMRAADATNTKYATVLGPTLAKLEAERVAIASGAVATAREEVANAWGRPAADTLPPMAAAQADALAKARATGKLEEQIKVLMQDTPVL
jgi:hypothetical protein